MCVRCNALISSRKQTNKQHITKQQYRSSSLTLIIIIHNYHFQPSEKKKVKAKIQCNGYTLTGQIEEGSNEGMFQWDKITYTGQFRDNKPHGKGVLKGIGYEGVGDWVDGWLSGYAEMIYPGSSYRGQCERGRRHGYVEEIDKDGNMFQGQWDHSKGKHGMMRRTLASGSAQDTLWDSGRNTGELCGAEDAVEQAEQGTDG